MTQQQLLRTIAQWINESVSAEQIERLTDHIEGMYHKGAELAKLAANFVEALGQETGDEA